VSTQRQKELALAAATTVCAVFAFAAPAGAAGGNSSCVGAYSSHYAEQGQRDEVAHLYTQGAQPYSFVAEFHGDVAACDEQIHG
jgi:hypothetical protein